MNLRFPAWLILLCLLVGLESTILEKTIAAAQESTNLPQRSSTRLVKEFATAAAPLFEEFCFKCHSDKKTKAHLNLQQISSAPDFPALFKTWEKVIAMLDEKEMPPEDEPQPTEAQRKQLIATVRGALDDFIRQEAGDPGRIALRRLTSAEYAYSIQDLTGLDLGLERNFISDAVGGEGFSNVGDVQFIQDSTLEHYLEAAKIVASHAVIGAGPLRFYRDPGRTGQELSAIRRIQEIYQRHGFRTASGEGGKAFGLDHYPKAFYAAWRFQHRAELGLENQTLGTFAHEEGLDAPFVEHIWKTLQNSSAPFPLSEIINAWRELPPPHSREPNQIEKTRAQCDNLYTLLQTWQTSFAENTGDAEVASVLTETSFRPSLTNSFRIRFSWPPGTEKAAFHLSVTPALAKPNVTPTVLWREPTLRFRKQGQIAAAGAGRRARGVPLRDVVTDSTADRLKFGSGLNGDAIGTNDFVTAGSLTVPIEFKIPPEATQAELTVEARLDTSNLASGDDCVVRCVLSHNLSEGATAAATGTFSLLLANPNGAGIETLKAGVAEFARSFPQISHREAAPADRDPIPPPFNSDYNNAERNEFHATVKYHRDDRFLTEHILEDATRKDLDQAWTDLLTAFDYYDIFLRFVAKKYQLNPNLKITTLTPGQINQLPEELGRFVKMLHDQYATAQEALKAAEPGHVDDAIQFARL
jgi:hypothetical protein